MEKVAFLQQKVIDLLQEWLPEQRSGPGDVRNYLIADKEQHHYQLLRMGWNGRRHIFDPLLHFDIIDEKIWLQANNTDVDVGEDLVRAGVDRQDIVLGLQPPFMRPHTEYGVG